MATPCACAGLCPANSYFRDSYSYAGARNSDMALILDIPWLLLADSFCVVFIAWNTPMDDERRPSHGYQSCAFSTDVLLGRPLEMYCQATTERNFVTVVSILLYSNVRFSR